ncbi:hypothetical protein Syun_022680 [Stephania yunnanensis]|uniref:AB hydrolase-1 domain-containing protein n=1 Tax=Stephania yunnanensis TaxID=152371 RepID=A0AAP0F860_9MAGN
MHIFVADVGSKLQIVAASASTARSALHPPKFLRFKRAKIRLLSSSSSNSSSSVFAKPLICTADEIHYVAVPDTDWRLALWRYVPSLQAPRRNRPLLLLSGVGTNAIGFDLSTESSFARHMSSQGFDTWILEVRGAGLSTRGATADSVERSMISDTIYELANPVDKNGVGGASSIKQNLSIRTVTSTESQNLDANGIGKDMGTVWDESQLVTKLTETFVRLSERLSGFLSEGQSRVMFAKLFDQISKLLEDAQLSEGFNEIRGKLSGPIEANQKSAVATQVRDLSQRLVNIIEEGQRSVSPKLFNLQERFSTTIDNFQKQLDLIVKYDWDFDDYLQEDVPTAMEYIRTKTKPEDGKLFAIGHSMGGMLLYAMLSRCCFEGRNSGFKAVVTLGSSLDYTTSRSSLKLLLPLADPAQALNVPVVPLGTMLAAAHPFSSRPPYILSWLNDQISAEGMMHPELLEKLVLNNFCTIPAKLILQLTTAFRQGGLRDRTGTFFYKDHLHKSEVPVLALAGDQDLICPPEAVYETVKIIPQNLVTYKVLGEENGPHYAHYDLVGGRMAVHQVYPCIVDFLARHDT